MITVVEQVMEMDADQASFLFFHWIATGHWSSITMWVCYYKQLPTEVFRTCLLRRCRVKDEVRTRQQELMFRGDWKKPSFFISPSFHSIGKPTWINQVNHAYSIRSFSSVISAQSTQNILPKTLLRSQCNVLIFTKENQAKTEVI